MTSDYRTGTRTGSSPTAGSYEYSIRDHIPYSITYSAGYSAPIMVTLLMYKGWITENEWLRYLYIQRFKMIFTKLLVKNMVTMRRKTIKSLSPVIRNHRYGRA